MIMKSAAVVVLYNPTETVIKNINTYSAYIDKMYLVDNSDYNNYEFSELISRQLNKCQSKYINLGGNYGIAKAINVAAHMAIEDGFDWLLTMDQDSSFKNNIVDVYKSYIEKEKINDVAILSPVYMTDRRGGKTADGYDILYWTMQSANFINLKAFSSIGDFDESYFIDCVDYEYCLRAKESGYRIIRCNKAVLLHNPGITKEIKIFGKTFKYGYASKTRIYYQVRNALYMFKKYHNARALGIVAVKIGKVVLLFDNKKEYINILKKAFCDYKRGTTGKLDL